MRKCICFKRTAAVSMIGATAFLCLLLPLSYGLLAGGDILINSFTAGENTSCINEVFGSYKEFEKGKYYEKKVTVKNEGTVPCYVRIFAEIEEPDTAEAISVDFNTVDWTKKQADGFYYYREALAAGEITRPLFTQLKAEDDVAEFEMICCSETVQAYGAGDAISAFEGCR